MRISMTFFELATGAFLLLLAAAVTWYSLVFGGDDER